MATRLGKFASGFWQRVKGWFGLRDRRAKEPSRDVLPDKIEPIEDNEPKRTLSGSLPELAPRSIDRFEAEPTTEELHDAPGDLSPEPPEERSAPATHDPEEPINKKPAAVELPAEERSSTEELRSLSSASEESDRPAGERAEEVPEEPAAITPNAEEPELPEEPATPSQLSEETTATIPVRPGTKEPSERKRIPPPLVTAFENWPEQPGGKGEVVDNESTAQETRPADERLDEELPHTSPVPRATEESDQVAVTPSVMSSEEPSPATPGMPDTPDDDESIPQGTPETEDASTETQDKTAEPDDATAQGPGKDGGDWGGVLNAIYKASRRSKRPRPDPIEERQARIHQRQAAKSRARRARLGLPARQPLPPDPPEDPEENVPPEQQAIDSDVAQQIVPIDVVAGEQDERSPVRPASGQPAVEALSPIAFGETGRQVANRGRQETTAAKDESEDKNEILPPPPDVVSAVDGRRPPGGQPEEEQAGSLAVRAQRGEVTSGAQEAGAREGMTSKQADKMIELLGAIKDGTEGIPEALNGVQQGLEAVAEALPNAGTMV